MRRTMTLVLLAVGLPPLLLAALGTTHPASLDVASAARWRDLHIVLLPLFPLLALGPWLVARRTARPGLAWVVAALGYVFAAFYTALDVLAGIGAGALEARGFHTALGTMFANGNDLARVGVDAYLAASLLAAGAALLSARLAAVPGAVLVAGGAISFLDSHVYWPRGVLTMLVLAVGWTALAWAVYRRPAAAPAPVAAGVSQPAAGRP